MRPPKTRFRKVVKKLEESDEDENLEKAYVKWVKMYGAKNVEKDH